MRAWVAARWRAPGEQMRALLRGWREEIGRVRQKGGCGRTRELAEVKGKVRRMRRRLISQWTVGQGEGWIDDVTFEVVE